MKTFYTARDIEDMHTAGTTEIRTHDDVVLTDVAREKAIALGMRLTPVDSPPSRGKMGHPGVGDPPAPRPASATISAPPTDDATAKIKAAVIARLGTHKYDDLLDVIIPQVMDKLGK
jgi:hypothetical protein